MIPQQLPTFQNQQRDLLTQTQKQMTKQSDLIQPTYILSPEFHTQFEKLSTLVQKTFSLSNQNPEIVCSFEDPISISTIKIYTNQCKNKEIANNNIYYICFSCNQDSKLYQCAGCFDLEKHKGHKYLDYKDDELSCSYNWIQNFQDFIQNEWQKQQEAIQSKNNLIKYYQQCLTLYFLLKKHEFEAKSKLYFQKFINFLLESLPKYNFLSQIILELWEKLLCRQKLKQIPAFTSNENFQFNKLLDKSSDNPKFYEIIYRQLFTNILCISEVSENKKYCLAKLRALAILCEDKDLLISSEYPIRIVKLCYAAINEASKLKLPKIKQYTCRILQNLWTKFFSKYNNKNNILFAKFNFNILAKEGSIQIYIDIIKEKFRFTFGVSELNEIFKSIYYLSDFKQNQIPLFFKNYGFERDMVKDICFNYLSAALQKMQGFVSILVLRSISMLVKQYNLEKQLAQLWHNNKNHRSKIELIRKILAKQYNYQLKRYKTKNFEHKNIKISQEQKNLYFEQTMNWIHSLFAFKKQISLYLVRYYEKYANPDHYNYFIDHYCSYSSQGNKIVYIAPDRQLFNPDLLLKYLLDLKLGEQLKIADYLFKDYQEYYKNECIMEIVNRIFGLSHQKDRKQYLKILFNDAFDEQNEKKEEEFDKKNYFQELKVLTILNGILTAQNKGIIMRLEELKSKEILEKLPKQSLGLIEQFVGEKLIKKEQNMDMLEIEQNISQKQIKEQIILSQQSIKMKKIKDKFKQKASIIRKNIYDNGQKKQEEQNRHTCLICKQGGKQNLLFFVGTINDKININILATRDHKVSIIKCCFHSIHLHCLSANKSNKCPLCKTQIKILLPIDINLFSEDHLKVSQLLISEKQKFDERASFLQFFQSQLYYHGFGLFQPRKDIHHQTFQFSYFPKIMFYCFQAQKQSSYNKLLKESYHNIKEGLKLIKNKILRAIKQLVLETVYIHMEKQGNFTEQDISYLNRLIRQMWDEFKIFSEIKVVVEHLLKIVPQLKLQINPEEQIYLATKESPSIFLDFMDFPANMSESFLWRQKHVCGRLKAQFCLLCKKIICEFCQSISTHNESSHNCNSLFLSLQSGSSYYYTENSRKSMIIYEDRFQNQFKSSNYNLEKFKFNKLKFNKFLYQWIYTNVSIPIKNMNLDQDW